MAAQREREASSEACEVFAEKIAERLDGMSRSSEREAIEASRTPGI